ncbi:hypothetical protein [Chamaesiphon sp.]|uniref:hypothetical protein n=1 Tax=Chamaesiphon sp. TaxID=2814140 RepID=UPI0035932BE2
MFRINFVAGKPLEVLLAKFLKSIEGTGKEKVIAALSAFYHSIALSQEPGVSLGRIELAASQDLAKLRNQIDYIINYHRITNGIELAARSEASTTEKIAPAVEHSISSGERYANETLLTIPTVIARLPRSDETYDYTIFDE